MPYCSLSYLPRCIAASLTAACLSCAIAQEAPIETELSQNLAGDRLTIGSSFALQVLAPWQRADCRLASGTVLHANVQAVTRTNRHTQGIAFTVHVPCGEAKPLEPVVTSLLAAPKIEEEVQEFSGFDNLGGVSQPRVTTATLNPFDVAKPPPFAVRHTTTKYDQLPKTVTLGEVWHIPNIKLVLPSGDSRESSITTEKPSLRLSAKTVFVLQIVREGNQPLRAIPTVASHAVREGLRSTHPFIGPCRAGQCTSDPEPFSTLPFGFQRAGDAEDLSRFGIRPESETRELSQLQQTATVHFMSNAEVLVTFPTHELVRHSEDERPTDNPQQVRAVLFNVETRSVERMESWIIDDHNAYIWPFGRNLLVHEGRFLKVYGPGLQELDSLPLDLPLASLRASPDGKHLLVGELRELHSRKDHLMLVDTLPRAPQEEVQWSLLDENLKRIRTLGTSSSYLPTPILLDDNMIELRKGQGTEWFLVGKVWDNNSDRQLGSLRSACVPVLDTLSPDLLAVTTCDTSGKAMNTVVTRKNGSPVIDQTSTRQDLPASTAGSSASARFALMLTRARESWDQGRPFSFSMVKAQRIEVLGSEDGSLVASIPLPAAEHSNNSFALSPDGSMLALVAGHDLTLYELPH